MSLIKNKKIAFGGSAIILFGVVAIFALYIAPYEPWKQDLMESFRAPDYQHLFGTDNFGRDVFSRVVYGTRISLAAAFGSTGLASIVGFSLGLIAGYAGGIIDRVVQAAIDTSWSFPTVLLAIILASITKPGMLTTIISISIVYWAQYARIIRGEVLSVREEEYVQAAQSIGCSDYRIMTFHVLPNVLSPVIVMISTTIGYALLLEAMLSFLGVGVQPPTPSWGIVLSQGRSFIRQAPWIALFPGGIISIAVLSFNFLGDGLRDYLDPHIENV